MIENYLSKKQLWEIAQFCKRIGFNAVYEVSEGHGEQQKNNAYYTLEAIGKLQEYLCDIGFSPR